MTTSPPAAEPVPVAPSRPWPTRRVFLAILLASPLAACGKRGRLELPPGVQRQRGAPPPPSEGEGDLR